MYEPFVTFFPKKGTFFSQKSGLSGIPLNISTKWFRVSVFKFLKKLIKMMHWMMTQKLTKWYGRKNVVSFRILIGAVYKFRSSSTKTPVRISTYAHLSSMVIYNYLFFYISFWENIFSMISRDWLSTLIFTGVLV